MQRLPLQLAIGQFKSYLNRYRPQKCVSAKLATENVSILSFEKLTHTTQSEFT